MFSSQVAMKMKMHMPIAFSPHKPKTWFSPRKLMLFISARFTRSNALQLSKEDTLLPFKESVELQHHHALELEDMVRGKPILDGRAHRQIFIVRSIDTTGPGMKTSIEAITNYLQDAAINNARCMAGCFAEGLGLTIEMSRQDLTWVILKMHIMVERYPSWNDIIQVDTWMSELKKTGQVREWLVRDYKTGRTLIQASSFIALMNTKTRRLSKCTKKLEEELSPYLLSKRNHNLKDGRKFSQIDEARANYIRKGLRPGINDMDANNHVNHSKYINWLLESTPPTILESYELSSITIEFQKECHKDDSFDSLTREINKTYHSPNDIGRVELEHSLRFDNGLEFARGMTLWKPKHVDYSSN